MATQCWKSVRSCAARLTRVDTCGRPVTGADSVVATDGYISIAYKPNISEGDDIEVKNACGQICIADKAKDQVKWVDLEIAFCGVDPDAVSLITGFPLAQDYAGDNVGFEVVGSSSPQASGFALEAWSEIPNAGACAPGSLGQWGYFLTPWVVDGMITDFTLENGAATFTFTGRTHAGSLWDVGPHDVQAQDVAGTPGPLVTPFRTDGHLRLMKVTLPPPTPVCGAYALT